MNSRNTIFLGMFASYLAIILLVIFHYNSNASVSNIICNDPCKHYILFFMSLLGIGTVAYELERKDSISVLLMGIMLAALYGLTLYNEENPIHYVFASVVFVAILGFMFRHDRHGDDILRGLFLMEGGLGIGVLISFFFENIFVLEAAYILNFAVYYIYLHFYENTRLNNDESNVAHVAYDDHEVVKAIPADAVDEIGYTHAET